MECSVVDWCKVWEILFTAFVGALFTVVIGGAAAILVNVFYRRPKYERQEAVLLELARLRTKGVALRNEPFEGPLAGATLRPWHLRFEDWKAKLYETASSFSPVEAERLRTLDWVPQLAPDDYPELQGIREPEIILLISRLSEILKRLDRLLEQRFRPTQAP